MFACIFSNRSSSRLFQTPDSRIIQALDPFKVSDKTGKFADEQAKLYQSLTFNTPESLNEVVPTRCPTSGLVIVSWVRLDNRSELADKLSIDKTMVASLTDPQMILASYRAWGKECVVHLCGDFSFVIYQPDGGLVFAARDSIGVKPFYYQQVGGDLVIASGARVFSALEGLSLQPSTEWLSRYVLGISGSFENSPWPNIKKLAPGHTLQFSDHKVTVCKYHEFIDDAPEVFERSKKNLDEYKDVLEQANVCRLRSLYPIGSETSGGLDSSTVTAYAAKHRNLSEHDIHTFGYAFCEREPSYILETSQFHGLKHNHILTSMGSTTELVESRHRALALIGYPEEHANGSSHDPFYRICEKFEIRTLLSGFGGDEVVTSTGSLLLNELIGQKKYGMLYQNLPGSNWVKPLRFARTLFRNSQQNGESGLSQLYAQRWPLYSIHSDIGRRFDLREHFVRSAIGDTPFRSINQSILGAGLGTNVPTRLENCTLIAAGRKVEYRWPLLDRRLLQKYLSTPSIEKYGGGYSRYLHRRAMVGLVPDKVTWKVSKAMGQTVLPVGYDSASAGNALSSRYTELLSDLHPALQEIIDVKKLTDQIPMIDNLDRVRDVDTWMILLMQQTQIKNLNDWLNLSYS